MATSIWDLIDVGSFSSLWFWLFMGAFWARVMQAPLGVPVDLVRRAGAGDAGARHDLEALSGVRIAQEQALARSQAAIWRVGGWSFLLALLTGLATVYRIELAQAVLALAAPFAAIQALETRAALRMAEVPDMTALIRAHTVLRRKVQVIGIAAVFFTTIFGMLSLLADMLL